MAPDRAPKRTIFQMNDFLNLPIRDRVQALSDAIIKDPDFFGFDTYALRSGVKLVDVQPNITKWEIEIGSHLCNRSRNLHGGAAATILDNLTSTALLTIAKPGFLDGGHVSRTITMSYLRPVPIGAKVTVDCEVQSAGRNMANIVGKIFLDGKLCVSCVHDKAVFARQPAAKL
ncbi:hypothetical protein A1O1_06987 [Capronia coronata CBS 617.96]|uniref:Thioesterase domain-containing protein n=1 Tax=Capronia coronata CBS 617.96 TaxID=1182541 RepID=W9Y2D2_9EURO|nr:uncharacterized protein A1O1_06987 [Capronia coronata CBS 617.96]EXJ83366.1 hypothetical protein A1O1_06987 [Capronia coronata CBS 617.96]